MDREAYRLSREAKEAVECLQERREIYADRWSCLKPEVEKLNILLENLIKELLRLRKRRS